MLDLLVFAIIDGIKSRRLDLLLLGGGFFVFTVFAVGALLSGDPDSLPVAAIMGVLAAAFLAIFIAILRRRP